MREGGSNACTVLVRCKKRRSLQRDTDGQLFKSAAITNYANHLPSPHEVETLFGRVSAWSQLVASLRNDGRPFEDLGVSFHTYAYRGVIGLLQLIAEARARGAREQTNEDECLVDVH